MITHKSPHKYRVLIPSANKVLVLHLKSDFTKSTHASTKAEYLKTKSEVRMCACVQINFYINFSGFCRIITLCKGFDM
jgi:hypothetical protein